MSARGRLAALAALLLCGPAAARAASSAPVSVLLVGWDGCDRKHVLRLLQEGKLPRLASLAAQGSLVATEVTTGHTQTKPGWAEILTGYAATRTGVLSNSDYKPIPKGWTIFERLKERFGPSFATIMISGKGGNVGTRGPHEIVVNAPHRDPITHKPTGYLDRDSFDGETLDGKPPVWAKREGEPFHNAVGSWDVQELSAGRAPRVERRAEKAFDGLDGRRFFAFVHFADPDENGHLHGEGSPEYDRAIMAADHWTGALLDHLAELGVSSRTVVYLTTDHGMDVGGHQHDHAPETFVAAGSGRKLRAGDRKDVTPTIYQELGLPGAGAPWDPPLDGRSLLEAVP